LTIKKKLLLLLLLLLLLIESPELGDGSALAGNLETQPPKVRAPTRSLHFSRHVTSAFLSYALEPSPCTVECGALAACSALSFRDI
jgi:hypothetical protein